MNWFADDQWRFNTFTKHIAPYFDISVTTDRFSLPNYKNLKIKNVILSQWGGPVPSGSSAQYSNYEYDITFVGGYNLVRGWYIQFLIDAGFNVQCFGAGWPNGRVSQEEMVRIFNVSKICLNLSNSQPANYRYLLFMLKRVLYSVIGISVVKMGYLYAIKSAIIGLSNFLKSGKRVEQVKARNFEIPASGGFQISHFALQLEDFFRPGKEIAIYSTPEELVQLVRYYLEHDVERENIRQAGYIRSQEHSYDNRMEKLLSEVESIIGFK